jgi:hypothetical protein
VRKSKGRGGEGLNFGKSHRIKHGKWRGRKKCSIIYT